MTEEQIVQLNQLKSELDNRIQNALATTHRAIAQLGLMQVELETSLRELNVLRQHKAMTLLGHLTKMPK